MFSQVARKVVNVNLGLKVHLSFNFSFGRACRAPKVLSQYGTKLTGKIPEKKSLLHSFKTGFNIYTDLGLGILKNYLVETGFPARSFFLFFCNHFFLNWSKPD